jgi:hypothetical protein
MLTLLDRLYMKLQPPTVDIWSLRLVGWYLVRVVANTLLPVVLAFTSKISAKRHSSLTCDDKLAGQPELIVSLTSFPARIGRLWLVIECLLRQSKKPDRIMLWLSKDQFPSLDVLPQSLLSRRSCGLEIRLVESDIRSHKKWFYCFTEFPNASIVIVDDDVFYPKDLLRSLVTVSAANPKRVVANVAHRIGYSDRQIKPYTEWSPVTTCTEGFDVFPVGVGGVLYPPSSLHKAAFDIQKVVETCPTADDIWLKACTSINDVPAITTGFKAGYIPILFKNRVALNQINVSGGANDEQLAATDSMMRRTCGVSPWRIY